MNINRNYHYRCECGSKSKKEGYPKKEDCGKYAQLHANKHNHIVDIFLTELV